MKPEDLNEIERFCNAATPGPWDWAGREFETPEEMKAFLNRMVDFYPQNLFIHGVAHMLDGTHTPDYLEDMSRFVMPAITGNGPTAEANAKFLEVARQAIPAMIAEIRRLWAQADGAQLESVP